MCAIVTGSASGLGAATAAILARGGARIVVNYSSSKKEAEATADLCRSAGGEAKFAGAGVDEPRPYDETRRTPSVRILARRPPRPLRAASAPGAKARSIQ